MDLIWNITGEPTLCILVLVARSSFVVGESSGVQTVDLSLLKTSADLSKFVLWQLQCVRERVCLCVLGEVVWVNVGLSVGVTLSHQLLNLGVWTTREKMMLGMGILGRDLFAWSG